MIGCLRTRVRKKPIIALYFESENELKCYNLEARSYSSTRPNGISMQFSTNMAFLKYFFKKSNRTQNRRRQNACKITWYAMVKRRV